MDGAAPRAWTMEDLLAAELAGERLRFLCFWGHTPPADGAIGAHVLSQWFEHPFELDGVRYPTAEHAMMAGKARLFGDDEHLAEILAANSPGAAKALGGAVRGFDEATWHQHRFDLVVRASVAKFASDDRLRDYLVGTRDRVLVEASPRDVIWGVGLTRDDPDVEVPSRWRGSNLLGFALMAARAQLA